MFKLVLAFSNGGRADSSESRQTSKNDFASIAPKSPATQAIQQALKKLPPKPDASGVESEVAIFQRLLHDFNQEYNVNQSEIDRETIASLSELQTRFLIESDVAGQSAQLYAQIELHHDFVAKISVDRLKKEVFGSATMCIKYSR